MLIGYYMYLMSLISFNLFDLCSSLGFFSYDILNSLLPFFSMPYVESIYNSISNGLMIRTDEAGSVLSSNEDEGTDIIIKICCKIIYYLQLVGIFLIIIMLLWICIKYVMDGRIDTILIMSLSGITVIFLNIDNIVVMILKIAASQDLEDIDFTNCPTS